MEELEKIAKDVVSLRLSNPQTIRPRIIGKSI
jgi:hypothetical protein